MTILPPMPGPVPLSLLSLSVPVLLSLSMPGKMLMAIGSSNLFAFSQRFLRPAAV